MRFDYSNLTILANVDRGGLKIDSKCNKCNRIDIKSNIHFHILDAILGLCGILCRERERKSFNATGIFVQFTYAIVT